MPKCAIKKCRNNTLTTKKKDGVTYHRFPVHEITREKWRKLVARERSEEFYKPNKSSVICSDHFIESDVYYTAKRFKRLKKTAVPDIKFDNDPELSQSRKRRRDKSEPSEQQKSSHVRDLTTVEQEQHLLSQTANSSPVHKSTLSSPHDPDGLDSNLNTPKTSQFKKELRKCHRKLHYKDRQVRNLKKQNKRLVKANSSLKEIVQDLKKKRLIDDSLSVMI